MMKINEFFYLVMKCFKCFWKFLHSLDHLYLLALHGYFSLLLIFKYFVDNPIDRIMHWIILLKCKTKFKCKLKYKHFICWKTSHDSIFFCFYYLFLWQLHEQNQKYQFPLNQSRTIISNKIAIVITWIMKIMLTTKPRGNTSKPISIFNLISQSITCQTYLYISVKS